MRRLRRLPLVILALLSTAAFADTETMNRGIAALYIDAVLETAPFDGLSGGAAAQMPARGPAGPRPELIDALNLVEAALAYDPSSSDALFLRGFLNRHDQSLTQEVVADYTSALVLDTFRAVNSARAAIAYAELLYRTRQYVDVLGVLDEINRDTPEFSHELEAAALAVEVRAALAAEQWSRADSALEAGQTRYPDDGRFLLLSAEREPVPSFRYRREIERLITARNRRAESRGGDAAMAARSDEALNEAVLRYALTAPTASEQLWAADRYIEMDGGDPALALVAPASIPADEVVRRFTERDGYARRDVLLALLEAAPSEVTARLLAGAEEWSGASHADRDGDGYWEERVVVTRGSARQWDVDANQNGVPEYSVSFADGEPDSVVDFQGTGGAVVRADYERYPYVSRVVEELEDGYSEYSVTPFMLQIPVVAEIPAGGPRLSTPLTVARGFRGIDLAAVRRGATAISRRSAAGTVLEERTVEDGAIRRVSIDEDGDGAFDRLVVYRAGLPHSALRDIDGDGYFEVAEAYENGQIAAVVIDDDDNGTPDVVEYERAAGIREWDLDQDGAIDVREFGILTERVRVEFPFLERNR